MLRTLSVLSSLLLAVTFLLLGTGLFSTFIGLRTALEGFPREVTGLMMSGYYVGFIIGALRCGPLINRVGHIRAFAAFCAISTVAVLVFPFWQDPWFWLFLRAVIGFNMAGCFIAIESWLNTEATPRNRASLMAVYMVISYLALGSGQLLLNTGDVRGDLLFMFAALLICFALVPIALTRATHPAPVATSNLGLVRLVRISPLAVAGCFCAGLSAGAIYGLGPVYGSELGMTVLEIGRFMAVFVVSGLILQYPVGRLSDRMDRRRVLLWVVGAAALASLAMVVFMHYYTTAMDTPHGIANVVLWVEHPEKILALAALYGGLAFTVYPLSVAYANDMIEPTEMVQASGGMLLTFGVGAAAGPLLAAAFMRPVGPEGLFVFTGVVALALGAFTLYRLRVRPEAPTEFKESFVAMPEMTATPAATPLDPRTDEALLDTSPEPEQTADLAAGVEHDGTEALVETDDGASALDSASEQEETSRPDPNPGRG